WRHAARVRAARGERRGRREPRTRRARAPRRARTSAAVARARGDRRGPRPLPSGARAGHPPRGPPSPVRDSGAAARRARGGGHVLRQRRHVQPDGTGNGASSPRAEARAHRGDGGRPGRRCQSGMSHADPSRRDHARAPAARRASDRPARRCPGTREVMTMSEQKNGVAVVVGVGAGLGAAVARRFAQGYRVALVARSAPVIDGLAGEIRSAGGTALPVQSDATLAESVSMAYARIVQELGVPDVLVYNGGRRPFGTLVQTTPEVFEETWRVHTFGAFL